MAAQPCKVCGGYCIDEDTCYWSVLIGKPYDWRGKEIVPFVQDEETA